MTSCSCLLCNVCGCVVDGVAYRTSCQHFYCPPCAKAAFECSTACKICNMRLADADVKEAIIGIALSEDAIMESLYQALLQTNSFSQISDRMASLFHNVCDMNHFVTSQMQIASSQSVDIIQKLHEVNETQGQRLSALNQHLAEQEYKIESEHEMQEKIIRDSNRALNELQEAYNEKQRKCQAWEKAYNSVRGQITNRMHTADVSPDERRQQQRSIQAQPAFVRTSDVNTTSLPLAHAGRPIPSQNTSITTMRNVTNRHLTHTMTTPLENNREPRGSRLSSSAALSASRREYLGALGNGSNKSDDYMRMQALNQEYDNVPQKSRYFQANCLRQQKDATIQHEKRSFFDGF